MRVLEDKFRTAVRVVFYLSLLVLQFGQVVHAKVAESKSVNIDSIVAIVLPPWQSLELKESKSSFALRLQAPPGTTQGSTPILLLEGSVIRNTGSSPVQVVYLSQSNKPIHVMANAPGMIIVPPPAIKSELFDVRNPRRASGAGGAGEVAGVERGDKNTVALSVAWPPDGGAVLRHNLKIFCAGGASCRSLYVSLHVGRNGSRTNFNNVAYKPHEPLSLPGLSDFVEKKIHKETDTLWVRVMGKPCLMMDSIYCTVYSAKVEGAIQSQLEAWNDFDRSVRYVASGLIYAAYGQWPLADSCFTRSTSFKVKTPLHERLNSYVSAQFGIDAN